MGRCKGLYVDVSGSNLGVAKFFSFLFGKELSFLALGFRGYGVGLERIDR